MEERLARLEEDSSETKATLRRLEPMVERLVTLFEATVPHLATKAMVADLRTEMHAGYAALQLAMTERFNQVDGKFTQVDRQFAQVDRQLADAKSDTREALARTETNLYNEISSVANRLRNDISDLRTELRVGLMDKPGKTYMWGVLGVLVGTFALGLAGIAALR